MQSTDPRRIGVRRVDQRRTCDQIDGVVTRACETRAAMDFDLTEDQLALRAGASDVLDDLASPARVRAHTTTDAPFDRALWRRDGRAGLARRGGRRSRGRARARLGRGRGARRGARPPRRARAVRPDGARARRVRARPATTTWVRAAARPATRSRASRGTRPRRFRTRLRPTSRSCSPTTACTRWRSTERPRREPAMDLTRELGWLRVRPGRRAPARRRRRRARGCSTAARPSRAPTCSASASRALDMAVEYAKDRVQFGRPIGSFQAVKHRCADMLVDVEGMRSTVYWAAWCIGAGDADASVAASTAKIWCGDASKRVMASALQVHGGIGFTWEHDLHFFLKRAQLDQLAFGDAVRAPRTARGVAAAASGSGRECRLASRSRGTSRRPTSSGTTGAGRCGCASTRAGRGVRPRGEGPEPASTARSRPRTTPASTVCRCRRRSRS